MITVWGRERQYISWFGNKIKGGRGRRSWRSIVTFKVTSSGTCRSLVVLTSILFNVMCDDLMRNTPTVHVCDACPPMGGGTVRDGPLEVTALLRKVYH